MSIQALEILSILLISLCILFLVFVFIQNKERRIAKFIFVNFLLYTLLILYSFYFRAKYKWFNNDNTALPEITFISANSKTYRYSYLPFSTSNWQYNPNPSIFSFLHFDYSLDSNGNVISIPRVYFTGVFVTNLKGTILTEQANKNAKEFTSYICKITSKSFYLIAKTNFRIKIYKNGAIISEEIID